jgi:hypothetical protein
MYFSQNQVIFDKEFYTSWIWLERTSLKETQLLITYLKLKVKWNNSNNCKNISLFTHSSDIILNFSFASFGKQNKKPIYSHNINQQFN